MIQMLSHLTVAMTTGCDVEVTLHFVEIDTSVNAAAVRRAPDFRRLRPFGPLLRSRNNVVNVLLAEPFILVPKVLPPSARVDFSVAVPAQSVHALIVHPLGPGCVLASKSVGGKDAIACGILYVDVKIAALHADYDVEVDLHVMGDALLNDEVMCFVAAPPAGDFSP